jgi:tight adherence protein B
MSTAFDNILERVNSLDLDMLLSAIVIQHRVGGNLSSVLRTIAHTIRERLRIRGEISVLTAQARISSYVVSMLPVGVVGILFFIAPAYISKLFLPGMTRYMLIGGSLGIIAGFFTMRKIAAIDV